MFGWELSSASAEGWIDLPGFFREGGRPGDYLHVFDARGRRVTRRDLDFEAWHDWQAELARRLTTTIAFFYGNFVRGIGRVVIDGIEPVDRPSDSVQIELFEYVYHQILRKDAEWVARDLFREHYRQNAETIAAHAYDPRRIGCLLLYTSHETTLDGLIERPLDEGDLLANANTVIHLGKIREGTRFRRAMVIGKHRGSAAPTKSSPTTSRTAGYAWTCKTCNWDWKLKRSPWTHRTARFGFSALIRG